MRTKRITIILIIGLAFILTACVSPTTTRSPETNPIAPRLTAQQAQGIVIAAINASTYAIRTSSRYFQASFNYSNRQWMVTAWQSEEASKIYAGAVYIVDDTTGKLLNSPPVFNPK